MNWLRAHWARLKGNTGQLTLMMFGLTILITLFTLADLVFRHLLGLPKDTAAYLSALSVVVLLAVGMRRWSAPTHTAEITPEEEEN